MRPYKFIISGGGTGGHIYPAIAIARGLKARFPDAEFLFVGALGRMEMEKVPQAGFEIVGLPIAGIQRRLTLKNLAVPFKLLKSLWKSRKIVRTFKPDIAVGTGGYASAPLLKAAAKAGIPTLIQEQNSYAGITNKWLSKGAARICVAYPDMEQQFPAEKIVFTGNPVREDLVTIKAGKEEGLEYFDLDKNKTTLLVLGGSLGADRINSLIEAQLEFFREAGIQLIWQCGKYYFDKYKSADSESVRVLAFIDRMDLAYASADIIISRSGALSVSELCLVGKPVIFIPSPNVSEDHQTKNARAISDAGAAIMIPESELDASFSDQFSALAKDPSRMQELGKSIKGLAKPDATRDIVEQIIKLLPEI